MGTRRQKFATLTNAATGEERVPESPSENVSLRFNGWFEKTAAPETEVEVDTAAEEAKAETPVKDKPVSAAKK